MMLICQRASLRGGEGFVVRLSGIATRIPLETAARHVGLRRSG
jgi:hypothetical protein